MALSIVEQMANHLADMPPDLPVYTMLFPSDPACCIAIFPTGGGVGGNIGSKPTATFGETLATCSYIDYPGVQIQVRYTDPHTAFVKAEAIRVWLDANLPAGYTRCDTGQSLPTNLTNNDDLKMSGGPCYRWSVNFVMIKQRA